MSPRPAVRRHDVLGESALWWPDSQQVYWVDGFAPSIQCWEPGTQRLESVPLSGGPIGMIAATTRRRLLAMTDSRGVALFNLETGERTQLADPEHRRTGIGYNDGKVDPRGRLWVGTYDTSESEPRGCLWLLENGRSPRLADSGLPVVNGPAFSPDGRTLYLSDSVGRRILAYEVREDGTLGERGVLAEFSGSDGLPDGLTVDSQGCVWVAHWDGGQVSRLSPRGIRLEVIQLPAARVTSVAFGGADLCTLFVTTARYGLNEQQLDVWPDSGALFAIDTGVRGLPPTPLPLPFRCGSE